MDGPILINKNKGVKGNIYLSMFEKNIMVLYLRLCHTS